MTPLKTIQDEMVKKGLAYYSIKHGGQLITRQEEEMSPEQAAEELEQFVKGLGYSYVDVELSKRPHSEKAKGGNIANFHHRLSLKKEGAPITGPASASNGQLMDLLREIADLKAQIIEKTYEAKLNLLERKIEDIEKGDKNPIQEAALMALVNMFGAGNGIAAPSAAVVAGPPQGESSDDKSRLKSAIRALAAADPDYITTLEMLGRFAQKNPSQYEGFKPLLKAQL